MVLPPSSSTRSPFHLREREGGTGTFLHKRKEKNQNCLFFSGGGSIGFFCLFGSTGTEVLFPPTCTCTHMCAYMGSLANMGPRQLELFCQGLSCHFSPSSLA